MSPNKLDPSQIEWAERVIADAAATVVNQIKTRETHPSFGYTKTMIRASFARMEGAIGMYMALRQQANHITASTLVVFDNQDVPLVVDEARTLMRDF